VYATVRASLVPRESGYVRLGQVVVEEGCISIDRQRVAAVKQLQALRYRFDGLQWNGPEGVVTSPALFGEADATRS
jgi:hypothetical protein